MATWLRGFRGGEQLPLDRHAQEKKLSSHGHISPPEEKPLLNSFLVLPPLWKMCKVSVSLLSDRHVEQNQFGGPTDGQTDRQTDRLTD